MNSVYIYFKNLENCDMILESHSGNSTSQLSTSFPIFSAAWYTVLAWLSETSLVLEGLKNMYMYCILSLIMMYYLKY